jgi:hypothetical protein
LAFNLYSRIVRLNSILYLNSPSITLVHQQTPSYSQLVAKQINIAAHIFFIRSEIVQISLFAVSNGIHIFEYISYRKKYFGIHGIPKTRCLLSDNRTRLVSKLYQSCMLLSYGWKCVNGNKRKSSNINNLSWYTVRLYPQIFPHDSMDSLNHCSWRTHHPLMANHENRATSPRVTTL